MQKLFRPVASLIILAAFLLVALATGGSSNTSVKPGECKELDEPIVHPSLDVNILLKNSDDTPAQGIDGYLYITRQQVVDTTDCTFIITEIGDLDFTTGIDGDYSLEEQGFTNNNKGDLYRVELDVQGIRIISVIPYNAHATDFRITLPPAL